MKTVMTRRSESGMALVVVVCLAMLGAVLAAGIFSASTSQVKSARRYFHHEHAFYIAEAGIEHAASALDASDSDTFLTNRSFSKGSFQVTATSSPQDIIYIRSTGTCANISRTIEVTLLVPPSSLIPASADAALSYYGTNHTLYLQGSGGKISGEDYDVPGSFACSGINCWGPLTTNQACSSSVYTDNALGVTGLDKIEAPPPDRLHTGGGTLTESYWTNVMAQLAPLADLTVTGTVSYAGADMPIGTRAEPTVTVVTSNGVLNITGTVDGAGVLILENGAQFVMGGNFHYEGLVIACGSSAAEIGGHGTPKISGAVVCLEDSADFALSGDGGVRFSSAALANLMNLGFNTNRLSLMTWREIK